MDFLGIVEEITCDGRLIIQCKELPDIGDPVFDRKQKRLGTVRKVFGPVDGPYASVTPEKGTDVSSMSNEQTFFRGREQNAKGKRRNRRN